MALNNLEADWDIQGTNYEYLRINHASAGKLNGWLQRESRVRVPIFGTYDAVALTIEFAEAAKTKSIVNVAHYTGTLVPFSADPTRVQRIDGVWSALKLQFDPNDPKSKFKGVQTVTGTWHAKNPQPIIP